jgi:quercetin 2,3-dioxygenase
MIVIRDPGTIYQIHGTIQNGTFSGRWHFSFDQYFDPQYTQFGPLRV